MKTIRVIVIGALLGGLLIWGLRAFRMPRAESNPGGRSARAAAAALTTRGRAGSGQGAGAPRAASPTAAAGPSRAARPWRPCRSLGSAPAPGQPILVKVDRMDPDTMELTYALPKPALSGSPVAAAGAAWERVQLGNAPSLGRVGAPVLPVVPVRLIVARGYAVDSVEVAREQPATLAGSHRIEPRQPPVPMMPGAKAKSADPDPAIYLSNEPYPAQPCTVIGVQKKRGVSILIANLHPVAYYPASGKVVWYETLKLKVHAAPAAPAAAALPYRPDPVRPVADGTENPGMLEAGGYTTAGGGAGPASPGFAALGNLCRAGVTNRYVVVTSAAISNAATDVTVRDLVAQKQSRGISVAIVTMEDIGAGYPGVDDAEKLRNFITDAYSLWETDYVLLGGDVNSVPMRKLWNRCLDEGTTWYEDHIPSDLYFQCLDGEFNSNGNDKWGEETDGPGGADVDLLAEVYIGRASAENEAEMANFVDKVLRHENEDASAVHLRTALMAGEYLGDYPFCYGDDAMEELVQGSSLWGYTTLGFVANPLLAVSRMYDRDGAWSAADMMNALNSGWYGIVNHDGHANVSLGMRLSNANADALTNAHGFFAYSKGCLSGNYEADCSGEHFTSSTRCGAYGVVFNSRYGFFYSQNGDGPSQHLHRSFWDGLFREGFQGLGALNANSHEDNIWALGETEIRWCIYTSNLLGDPETPLRVPALLGEATVTNVTAETAVLGGSVVLTNGNPVTERGVFWGTNFVTVRSDGAWIFESGSFDTGAFSFLVTNLPAGQTVWFLAYAVNALGTNVTAERSFLTRPGAPVVAAASEGTVDSFCANWQAAAGAANYRLDVAPDGNFGEFLSGFSNRNVGAVTAQLVTGLQARIPYYYRVRAENGSGSGADSATQVVSAAAIGVSPGSLALTGTCGGSNPAPRTLTLANLGQRGGAFTHQAVYSAGASGWWTLEPATGSVGGLESVALTGTVNLAGLNAGAYAITNTIISPDATNDSQVFVVTLVVDEADPESTVNDYDGDGKTDLAVYNNGHWSIFSMQGDVILNNAGVWGGAGWTPVPGDYDGDGQSDLCVYNNGYWSICSIPNGVILDHAGVWGGPGWTPVPGDYDGDGKSDLCVYNNGYWSIFLMKIQVLLDHAGVWGGAGWTPVPGDYDGDGKSDLAVYQNGYWSIISIANPVTVILDHAGVWGGAGWTPVDGDYDGDGKSDLCVYNNGYWSIFSMKIQVILENAGVWGGAGWTPVSGDYDADGLHDLAVYNNGYWSIYSIPNGVILNNAGVWGGAGWTPVQ